MDRTKAGPGLEEDQGANMPQRWDGGRYYRGL